ncbi:MAG: hypothetical protein QXS37_05045, partial [Candidatus Aenigmatarchaeota archaeon]
MGIKVHLLVGNLPLYSELLETPPIGIEYVGKPLIKVKYYSLVSELTRKLAVRAIEILKLPRMTYVKT